MPTTGLSLPVLPTPPDGRDGRERLAAALRERLGDADGAVVRFSRHDRMLYSTDASIYQVEPIGVIVPRSIQEAIEALQICAEFDVPVLPRGGGTALAGQTVNQAVVLDLSQHCRRIIAIDGDARTARVEPGVVLDQLNTACIPHGLMFGPDVATSSHATLGGMIGNNSAGAWSIRYGRTVEHLIGVDVALADGRRVRLEEGAAQSDPLVRDLSQRVAAVVTELAPLIRERYPRIKRHVDGYNLDLLLDQIERSPGDLAHLNLAHLICGSEGTLATVLEATVGLVPRPKARGLAIAAFPDVDGAMDSLRVILETKPAAVELVDDVVIAMALANNECRPFVEVMPKPDGRTPGAVLYVEYFADEMAEITERFNALTAALPGAEIAQHTDPAAMQAAWRLRKSGEPLLHAIPGARKPVTFVEDTAVDPSRLPEFVREFRAIVARHGTTAAYYAHASVGCLHIRPLVCLRSDDDLRIMTAIAEEIADLVKRYDGALSGEHGDGRVRSPLLERYFGPQLCDGFRRIKAIFDPQGRMNPGNITDPGGLTDHLRVRPERDFVAVPPTNTFYRYEREHGFDHAVEMCNGAGICRRMTPGGTMCPSYRALLDERHATRGRGNALRLAITGQIGRGVGGTEEKALSPAPSWNDPETLDTLRLCLSCKACKTECPSNVDIAKLRSEYLAQGIEANGASLATIAIGNVRMLNRIASMSPRLATAIAGSAPGRWLAERIVGIDRRRSLPPFASSLHGWMRSREMPDLPDNAPTVILFPDCFTVYSEPHIGMAAVRSLEACGYRVILPTSASGVGCCGRSMMSVGMLRKAAQIVRATAEALRREVDEHRAMAIVGCEPSCISALRDDWLELDIGDDAEWLRGLAAQSALVEEFIDAKWESHPNRPTLAPDAATEILLHGHCHQKALWGVETSARLLRRIVGDRLSVLPTGCCGMAGSFGMTTDRYDLSMQIGELELMPALRNAPEATVCAPGTSCRHQIHDGAQRTAIHPIELFDRAVGGR